MSPPNKIEIPPMRPATRAASILQLARIPLTASPYPALRRLDCYFHEGVLPVRGRVSTFHERQMAWIVLCELTGVEEFVDRVEVVERGREHRGDSESPCGGPRRAK